MKRLMDPYEEARGRIERSCVLTYRPETCYNGYTLFSNYRGNAFFLMDMEGHFVHTWAVRPAKIGEVRPSGNLLYGHMWEGMAEVDWHSREVWYYPCSQHHDFCLMPNGHIMVLCGHPREGAGTGGERRLNREIYAEGEHITAYFIEVDPKAGGVVWRWEADDHIGELRGAGVTFPRTIADVYHSNTCEVLPDTRLGRRDRRFRAGNVVFSHRNMDVVGVIDRETGEVVWAWGVGTLDKQHMPTLIPDRHPITGEPMPGAGHFLIFDNGGPRRSTQVVELDPETEEIVWRYAPEGWWCGGGLGGADRMPNGNTVICEGGPGGRLFEVTPKGEIVWEYLTPYFDGTGRGRHSIYRCVRYPPQYMDSILEKLPPPPPTARPSRRK